MALLAGMGNMLNLLVASEPGLGAGFDLVEGLEFSSSSNWCSSSMSKSSSAMSIALSPIASDPICFDAIALEEDLWCARDDGTRFMVDFVLLCTAREDGDLMVPTREDERTGAVMLRPR